MVPAVLATAAYGQTPHPQAPTPPTKLQDRTLTPQELERSLDDINKASGVRMYEGLCARAKEFVAKKGAVSDPLLSEFNTFVGVKVLNALLNYCATGRFVLNFYEGDRKCLAKSPLAPSHVQLIARLPFVRSSDVEIIAMACVETSETIFLLNAHAHSILINDSELGGINITGGVLTSSIAVQDTVVKGSTIIDSMNIGSTLEISRSKLGSEGNKGNSLSLSTSAIGTLAIADTEFIGDVYVGDNQFKGTARIGRVNSAADAKPDIKVAGYLSVTRNDVKGDLRVTGAQITRSLEMQSNIVERAFYVGGKTAVGGSLELFGSRALTMELYGLDVADQVRAVAMRISETLYIGQNSTGRERADFKKNLNLTNLKADRVRIYSATVGEQLTLISMTVNDVDLEGVKVGRKIHSGDARIRTMNIRDSTIPIFECSDCEVSQYLLLAGRFSGEVNLRGAQIRASLIFRDGDGDGKSATWAKGAHLDLRSIQVETIEADLCDLRITLESGDKCSGEVVPTLITGAKFHNILPGRHLDASGMTGLLDQDVPTIVSWIKAGIKDGIRTGDDGELFHPQPYDLVADALDRAGRHKDAIGVRIAKLDADYATGNHSWFMKGVAKIGKLLTGYGYQNERSVLAFVMLVVAGIVAFLFGRHVSAIRFRELNLIGFVNVFWYAFWFSIDRAVPPLHIDESMKEYSVLTPSARAYFYLHRGVGTAIISFFVAGVTGLFK